MALGTKEGKDLKIRKNDKVTKSVKSLKSLRNVRKKQSPTKTDKIKRVKKTHKETLKMLDNEDASTLYKTIKKTLKEVVKNESRENQQTLKKENGKSEKMSAKKRKEVKKILNNGITQVVKNKKRKEVKDAVQVAKKQKRKKIESTMSLMINEEKEMTEVSRKSKKPRKVETKEKPVIKNEDSLENVELQLSSDHIKNSVAAILKLTKDDRKSQKILLGEEKLPIFLQVCCIKIPKMSSRLLRILLPHSLVSPDDDVALIVKDLQRGRGRDYEPTVDHFQQLLQEHKCSRIKTIIPLNQLKTEYDQYELKRNLLFSYDHFLIDGVIAGRTSRLLGKIFSKRRKLPASIRMNSKNLKHEVDYALKKTVMKLKSNGDSSTIQVGTTYMSESDIAENIEAVCKSLATHFPGGWSNIRSLRIKSEKSLAIPIYMTMKSKNTVNVPDIKPKRPKAYRTFEGELTTLSKNAIVTVTPDGSVTVKTEKNLVDCKKSASQKLRRTKRIKI